MASIKRVAYDTSSVMAKTKEHAQKSTSEVIRESQVTPEVNPLKEIDMADYITDNEKELMSDILSTSTVDIENDDKKYLKPIRLMSSMSSVELSNEIFKFFSSFMADVSACGLSAVTINGGMKIVCKLMFTLKPTKLKDDDKRFHNLIEIGHGKKASSDFAKQINNVSAHASGKYFKFNDATKKVLEKYISDDCFDDKMAKKINWEQHDKGLKTNLVEEQVQKVLPGNAYPQGNQSHNITAATMEYIINLDIDKILPDVVTLHVAKSEKEEKENPVMLHASVIGMNLNMPQTAFGPVFQIAIEEIDIKKDMESNARFGLGYVVSNNQFFGSNIR